MALRVAGRPFPPRFVGKRATFHHLAPLPYHFDAKKEIPASACRFFAVNKETVGMSSRVCLFLPGSAATSSGSAVKAYSRGPPVSPGGPQKVSVEEQD